MEAAIREEMCLRCFQTGVMRAVAGPWRRDTGVWHVRCLCTKCPGATGQTATFKRIEIGDPVTLIHGRDRRPGKIVQVYGEPNSKRRWVEVLQYRYIPAPHARRGDQDWTIIWTEPVSLTPLKYSLRGNGRWVRTGESSTTGPGLVIGHAEVFFDFEG